MESITFGPGLPRPLEVVASALGLIILAPLLLVAMAVIRLTSGSPVFFRQKRIGQQGRVFMLYKLRTMQEGASGSNFTAQGDSRITAIGRILRRTKVDEIPELWNVVTGDMSLVGPRPEVPAYVDVSVPEWQRVLSVRPGLTDPVTLRLRNEETLLARVTEDPEGFYLNTLQPFKLAGYLEYLHRRTWWSDIRIIFETLLCVLFPRRAPVASVNNELTNDYALLTQNQKANQ